MIGKVHQQFLLSPEEVDRLKEERRKAQAKGDFDWDRKCRALLLVGSEGLTKAEAALRCECSERAVFLWQSEFARERNLDDVRPRPRPGKSPRLSPQQLADLRKLILDGPAASGLMTGLWTSPVVAVVIEKVWGIKFHPSRVRKILASLGLSHQLPRKKLAKADLEAQKLWLESTFPAICKRAKEAGGRIFFFR